MKTKNKVVSGSATLYDDKGSFEPAYTGQVGRGVGSSPLGRPRTTAAVKAMEGLHQMATNSLFSDEFMKILQPQK